MFALGLLNFARGSLIEFAWGSLIEFARDSLIEFTWGSWIEFARGSLIKFALPFLICLELPRFRKARDHTRCAGNGCTGDDTRCTGCADGPEKPAAQLAKQMPPKAVVLQELESTPKTFLGLQAVGVHVGNVPEMDWLEPHVIVMFMPEYPDWQPTLHAWPVLAKLQLLASSDVLGLPLVHVIGTHCGMMPVITMAPVEPVTPHVSTVLLEPFAS